MNTNTVLAAPLSEYEVNIKASQTELSVKVNEGMTVGQTLFIMELAFQRLIVANEITDEVVDEILDKVSAYLAESEV